MVEQKIALDGLAMIVNTSCSVDSVTKAEVKALYESGTPIQDTIRGAISREEGSGTRDAFEELIGIESLYTDTGFTQGVSSTSGVISDINGNSAGNKFFSRKFKEGNEKVSGLAFKKRGSAQDALWILSHMVAFFVAAVLLLIVGFTLVNGLPHLSANFLFGKSSNANTTLSPAFVTTGLIILISLLIALPLGIGAAIYLNEYAKRGSPFVKAVRLFNDTLSGVPSIIFGLFGALFFGGFMNND